MIWKLLLAHVITDFLLQTKTIAAGKIKLKNNFYHCLILLIISTVLFINHLSINLVLMLLVISIFHGVIDFGKAMVEKLTNEKFKWLLFLIDQILHFIFIIIALYFFYEETALSILSNLAIMIEQLNIFRTSVYLLILTFGGSYFISTLCKGINYLKDKGSSLDDAGKYIGILERIIVALSIFVGRYEIIGFLFAAKSIIRHYEKKDQKAFAEYFLIGTFTSFIWAALVTYLYLIV